MALTADLKSELVGVAVPRPSAKKAEVAAMLRFAGLLQLQGRRLLIEVDLDSERVADRLAQSVQELYGHAGEVLSVAPSGIRRSQRFLVRYGASGAVLARQSGLLDSRGRPVRGMPPAVVGGSEADAEAAWRGAFLARGGLTEPGRSSALELTCPGPEAGLAMVGTARRLGVGAKAREARGADRVVIRDGDAITTLLTRMGSTSVVAAWEDRRSHREVKATAHRLANFDDANLRRSARAAVAAGRRVERAMEILGEDVPDHLRVAGELRLTHRQASLEELGQLADPPMTKDAVAGRIRRLLAMADRRAEELGIPGTETGITPEEV